MRRAFEELGDVCDAHELRLEVHEWLAAGRRGHSDAVYGLAIAIDDGADGKTYTNVGGAERLDAAAEVALAKLRKAGVVP